MQGYYACTDIEATGLLHDKCKICEVAIIIVDPKDLKEVATFSKIVNAQEAYWQPTALSMHIETGLYSLMGKHGVSEEVLKNELEQFLTTNMAQNKNGNPIPYKMLGSSVWFDRQHLHQLFGDQTMRKLFSHQQVDVSSIAIEVKATCGDEVAGGYANSSNNLLRTKHRALDDIRHSLDQLRYYRKHGLIGGQAAA